MRILLSSNAPWIPSGYGQQSKFLINALQKQGHEIIFATNFGLDVGFLEKDNVLFLPTDKKYNNNFITLYNQIYQPDLVISLMDWFICNPAAWFELSVPWFNWTPIDCEIIDSDKSLFSSLFDKFLDNCNVVTMSEFGTDQVIKFNYKPTAQIYHAIDPNIFKPMNKKQCRDLLIGNHEQYDLILGMVMGNYDPLSNRKQFDRQFEAVKGFAQINPKLKILLYIHTESTKALGGLDLANMIEEYELYKFIDILFTPPFKVAIIPFTPEELAQLYNCFDVVLNASAGEGFGVPIVEAQSCGVPVLTHNFSAMIELTHYGYAAESDGQWWCSESDYIMQFVKIDQKFQSDELLEIGLRKKPSISSMISGLQEIYESINKKSAQEAHEWVADNFNPTVIGEAWARALQS